MEISLKDIAKVIRKNLVFIVVLSLLCGAVSMFVTSFFVKKTYTSTLKLYVATSYTGQSAYEDYQSVNYAKNLVLTYIELLDSNTFYSEVSEKLNGKYTASQLKNMIKFESIDDTEVFKATVVSTDPSQAKAVGDAIADVAPDAISNVKENAQLKIVDEATLPKSPTSPNVMKNTLVAALAGLVLALIISFVRNYLDVKIKYNEDMTTLLDLPVLGVIPDFQYFVTGHKDRDGKSEKAPKTDTAY